MGRLYGSRCYLAGPMDKAKDGGVGWRQDLTPFLQNLGIVVLDPSNKKIDIGGETSVDRERRKFLKDSKQYDQLSSEVRLLRIVDLRMVDVTDFVIVNYDTETPMCGTMEEIFWANRIKHPVLFVCPQGKQAIHDWMFGTFPHDLFFSTWDELKKYLEYVNTTRIQDLKHYKRWMFFQYDELVPKEQV